MGVATNQWKPMGCDDGEEEGRAVYRALHSYSVDGAGLEGLGGPADGEHHGIKGWRALRFRSVPFKKKGFLFYVCRSRCANNIDVITWNLIGTGSMREGKIEEESWRDAVLRGEWNGV